MTENGHESVFLVHVMKTGGTTALHGAWRVVDGSRRYPDPSLDQPFTAKSSTRDLLALSPDRLATTQLAVLHVPLGAVLALAAARPSSPISTALLLRDPVDRARSHLQQIAQRLGGAYTYEELLDVDLIGDFFLSNHQTRALGAAADLWPEWDRAFAELLVLESVVADPQRGRITPLQDAHVDAAVDNAAQVDELGFVDRFDEWWDGCSRRYGWPHLPAEPKNVRQAGTLPPMSTAVLDELRERNRLDAELVRRLTAHR